MKIKGLICTGEGAAVFITDTHNCVFKWSEEHKRWVKSHNKPGHWSESYVKQFHSGGCYIAKVDINLFNGSL